MSALKRVNKADTASDQEIKKIEAKHKKQLNRLYSQEEWIFAIIAYIGPLFAFPLFMRQTSNFCQYHAKQGMLLFATEVIFWIGSFLPIIGVVFTIATFLVFVAGAVIGINNVINEREVPLPLIGKYTELE
ncbi:MAG: hypothetical protein NTZ80_02510 [Patescibacteria group bacterium]|nr:hypothetical protein [Patescibacteria group bacterium]